MNPTNGALYPRLARARHSTELPAWLSTRNHCINCVTVSLHISEAFNIIGGTRVKKANSLANSHLKSEWDVPASYRSIPNVRNELVEFLLGDRMGRN